MRRKTEVTKLVTHFIAGYSKWNADAHKRNSNPRCFDKSTGTCQITKFGLAVDDKNCQTFRKFAQRYFVREVHYRSIGIPCDHQPRREKISSIKQLEPGEWRVITDVKYKIAGVKFHNVYHYFIRASEEGKLYIDYVLYRDDGVSPPLVYQEL